MRRRNQLENLLILRILRKLRGTHGQRGRAIDCARHHASARIHFTRHRLAVDVAQVQRGHTRQQLAVDRHCFARQNQNHVAEPHLIDGDRFEALSSRIIRLRSIFCVRFWRFGHIIMLPTVLVVRFCRIGHSDGTESVGCHVGRMLAARRMHMPAHSRQHYHVRGSGRRVNQRSQVAFGLRLCEFLDRLAG